ncbi:MAG: rhomboid family intramembrane serine protease [Bacteroidota bacterium]
MNFNITTILIIANVAASFYAWNSEAVMSNWLMNPYQINRKNQYYRFLSSGFIHADYMHLFFNMFTLYSFGAYLESAYKYQYGHQVGGIFYLALFLIGILVSDMPSYFKHKDNPNYNSLGASGGVSAIIFACIMLNPWLSMSIYFIPIKGIFFAVLYVWYSVWMSKKGYDNINHSAHLYGGLFGVLFMAFTYPGAFTGFINQILNWREFM